MTVSDIPAWDHAPEATCGEVGEHALIRWIAGIVGTGPSADVLIGHR